MKHSKRKATRHSIDDSSPAEVTHSEQLTKAVTSNQSYKKLVGYLQQELRREGVAEKVAKLRKRLGIPEDGLETSQGYSYSSKEYDIIYPIFQEIIKMLKVPEYADELIEEYLFYGTVSCSKSLSPSLLVIANLKERKYIPFETNFGDSDDKLYPIAIKISPYASERDIINFVQKTYRTLIKPLQKKYKVNELSLGKVRIKSEKILRRNDEVYKTRSMKVSESVKHIKNKLKDGSLDEGSIGKIRSLEAKKRRKV